MTGKAAPKPTIGETIESLTGWDEVAIEAAFKHEFGELSGARLMRAVAFIVVKRANAGMKDRDAYAQVMGMTGPQVLDLFEKQPVQEVTVEMDGDFS